MFGSAQPTEEGFKNIVEKVRKECENKDTKMIWFNMRQEPVVYINSSPHAPRHPDHMHDNVEVGAGVHEMDVLEKHFEKILAARVSADSEKMLKINKDKSNTDNPMDRENVEEHVKVESVKSLQAVYEDIKNNLLQNFYHYRVPVVEETKPEVTKIICNNKIFYVWIQEQCFDIIVDVLKNEPAATQCVFSCQAGRGRTTLGMVVTCLVKEIQICCDLKNMTEMGLLPQDTVNNIISSKFESKAEDSEERDPLVQGEFDVIKELLAKLPEAVEGKKKLDRIIDVCGPGPRGTGLQNLRECIIETKWKYDVAPEDRQVKILMRINHRVQSVIS